MKTNFVRETCDELGLKTYGDLAIMTGIKTQTLTSWASKESYPDWFPKYCKILVENQRMKDSLREISKFNIKKQSTEQLTFEGVQKNKQLLFDGIDREKRVS